MRSYPRICGIALVVSLSQTPLSSAAEFGVIDATKKGNSQAIRALLKERADVNASLADGSTALHWAAHLDNLEIVRLLIQAGARVDRATDYGVTPLSLACQNGNAGVIEALLKAKANPNLAPLTGETPLMTAVRTGKIEAVRLLIIHGADVEARDATRGQTALMWAAAEGHVDVLRALLEGGANIRTRSIAGYTPLLFAARTSNQIATRLLLEAGATINEASTDGMTALVIATQRADLTYAKFLLDAGADPNLGPGFVPLHWAAGAWDTPMTGPHGINEQHTEWISLGGLRGQVKSDFLQLLLAHGADINARASSAPSVPGTGRRPNYLAGATAFVMAARAADVSTLKLLLAHGADAGITTNRRTTALMMAAGLGYDPDSHVTESEALEAVTLLVGLGSDVNEKNLSAETALHGAAYWGATTIAQFLIARGANLNAKNSKQWTPLAIAEGVYQEDGAVHPFPATVQALRELGAEPTLPGIDREARGDTR